MIETQRVSLQRLLKSGSNTANIKISTVAKQILELFPVEDLPPHVNIESDQEQIETKLKQVQSGLLLQTPVPKEAGEEQEDINRPGELYRRYRTVEELPESAKAFYERAGKFSF